MPQPVLHIIHAASVLDRWRDNAHTAIEVADPRQANAFLMGSLAPDMGLFPGGVATFSRLAHTGPTGTLTRVLLESARAPVQRAFALGWLAHVLTDIAVHPLVNREAATMAARPDGGFTLADHVRVEVGLDIRAAGNAPTVRTLRLHRALTTHDLGFLAEALADTCGYRPGPGTLLRMQAGMLHFTRLAIHFATRVAPDVCWGEAPERSSAPLMSAVAWRLLSSAGRRESLVAAYMNPVRPSQPFMDETTVALETVDEQFDRHSADGAAELADYDLETGMLREAGRQAAA